MVQSFTLEDADCFSGGGTAGEHQRGAWPGVGAEDRKHAALVVGAQVVEPSQATHARTTRPATGFRMSDRIQSWSGKRVRHSASIVGAASTPVTL